MNGTDLVQTAAIQPLVLLHYQAANGFLLNVIKGILEHELGHFFLAELLDELLADFVR